MKPAGRLLIGLVALVAAGCTGYVYARDELAPEPTHLKKLEVIIDKSEQLMYVYENGTLFYIWRASTGIEDAYTPTGNFTAQKVRETHHSSKYGTIMVLPVYYKGVRAIHGVYDVSLLGQRASMGCTHISPENAATFYTLALRAGLRNVKIHIQE